ncbi:MAG TPA: M48 family metallopeptidase [Pseudomonadales bacterium]
MNFFEYQSKARSSTQLLVLLFICAISALIVLTTLLAILALGLARADGAPAATLVEQAQAAPEVFAGVSAVVLSIVLLGTLFRTMQLRGGGKAVAESLGGRLLNVQTRDADERRVLNVVEEMAIAAGMPVPQVYLIEDPAINAFAAGYAQQDAVIGITRGCIELLDRDELQGVVAHEFSHILNGDMRLNIRLMGWLYGITVIGLVGYHLMHSMRYSGGSGRRRNGGGFVMLGIGLIVVGYGGTFFGKLIKAAVSRQREYLADASAVQFTRNLGGIAGALKKIAAHGAGSRITAVDTQEISHMLFGAGNGIASWFATHPPIEQRIRRIDPQWDGSLARPRRPAEGPRDAAIPQGDARQIFTNVGLLSAAAVAEAQQRLRAMPPALLEAAHSTHGSCMLVFALLVSSSDNAARKLQIQHLQAQLAKTEWAALVRVLGAVGQLERKLYLPLLEVALPALRALSEGQCERFAAQLRQLIDLDASVSLFEWCLFRIVSATLVRNAARPAARHSLTQCAAASRALLAALARAGNPDEAAATAAFADGVRELEGSDSIADAALPDTRDLQALDRALEDLAQLDPLQKPRLLKALVRCARADRAISIEEEELLRAIGAALDCPTPPLA